MSSVSLEPKSSDGFAIWTVHPMAVKVVTSFITFIESSVAYQLTF